MTNSVMDIIDKIFERKLLQYNFVLYGGVFLCILFSLLFSLVFNFFFALIFKYQSASWLSLGAFVVYVPTYCENIVKMYKEILEEYYSTKAKYSSLLLAFFYNINYLILLNLIVFLLIFILNFFSSVLVLFDISIKINEKSALLIISMLISIILFSIFIYRISYNISLRKWRVYLYTVILINISSYLLLPLVDKSFSLLNVLDLFLSIFLLFIISLPIYFIGSFFSKFKKQKNS